MARQAMCVRYVLHKPDAAIAAVAKALGVRIDPADWMAPPRYNVTLSHLEPVIEMQQGVPRMRPMRWGFVPPADRDLPKKRILANARIETLAHLPAFRAAAAGRRCLVPVDGFYEFKDLGSRKQAYVFMRPGEEPFALAGLWEPASGDLPPGFCVVTTAPNATMEGIHDRMPVVLTGDRMAEWLGDKPLESAVLRSLATPVPPDTLTARPVGDYVNNSRHDGPQCLSPPPEELPELF